MKGGGEREREKKDMAVMASINEYAIYILEKWKRRGNGEEKERDRFGLAWGKQREVGCW